MLIWLESLTALERVLLYVAVPATLILLIQTVLLLIGLGGGHDADGPDGAEGADLDGDGVPDDPPSRSPPTIPCSAIPL